ncbi:hypothetical protein LL912_01105 [Niabella sp. CC-SYL272]|uniref:hypothetical protein n=1 Tax=Niabella agricola TaxID=2891571 RepID=UPI001F3F1C47|nr:hypothetical protein [Niabella agricola]MCF3107366.1 hypothetical protein [Niabella agricola]
MAANYKEPCGLTLPWKDTRYDFTLPNWFLDRTFVNILSLRTGASLKIVIGA